MNDPNYAIILLNVFGVNLTIQPALGRKSLPMALKNLVYHPSQTRAIPQTKILQQLNDGKLFRWYWHV